MAISLNNRKTLINLGYKISNSNHRSVTILRDQECTKLLLKLKKKKGGGTTQAGIEQFHCMKFHFLRAIHQVVFV